MTITGRDAEATRRFIEKLALIMTNAGMQRMSARVFAALITTDSGGLTAAELGELLQVSPAAISGAVRYLEHIRLVQRAREPGERRDHFRMVENDMWYEAYGHNDMFYRQMSDILLEGVEAVGPGTRAAERINETREFFDFIAKELGEVVERWRVHRAELRASENRAGS